MSQHIEQKAHKHIVFPNGDKKDLKILIGNFKVEFIKI